MKDYKNCSKCNGNGCNLCNGTGKIKVVRREKPIEPIIPSKEAQDGYLVLMIWAIWVFALFAFSLVHACKINMGDILRCFNP
jgi:hypothetical protein